MHRLIEQWHSFWFPESSAYNLAICRIIIITAQLIFFFPSLEFHIDLVNGGTEFIEPQIFIVIINALFPADLVFTSQLIILIYWTTVAAGLTAVLGLATRASALIFALGNWFFVSLRYSYAEEHHPEAILCIFLLLLAFSPSGERLSLDALLRGLRTSGSEESLNQTVVYNTAMWPLILIQVLLSYAYFSTGIAKLLYSGFEWMNGYTLQKYILGNAIQFDRLVGIWLAQQYTLCYILSIATVLFEISFFIILFLKRFTALFLVGGILFHIGIYITMSAPFFQHIILYVVFIDFERCLPGALIAQNRHPKSVLCTLKY